MAREKKRDARESALASGWTVEEQQPDTSQQPVAAGGVSPDPRPQDAQTEATSDTQGETQPADEPAQLSNVALISLGLAGGLYLLYSWVWFSWARAHAIGNEAIAAGSGSIDFVMQQIVVWMAPLAPLLWLVCVFLLCRGAKPARIALWLGIGLVLLVPLPMFQGVIF